MKMLLITAASLGFAVSSAAACDFLHTASKVDDTKVASISADKPQNMSTPVAQPTTENTPVVIKKQTDSQAPAQTE
jgi:peroxiredoxin